MSEDRTKFRKHGDRGILRPLLRAARLVRRLEHVLQECDHDSARATVRHILEIARDRFRTCSADYLGIQLISPPSAMTEFSPRSVLQHIRNACDSLAVRRGVHCDFAVNPRIPDALRGAEDVFSRSLQVLCSHALHRTSNGGICVRVVVDRELPDSIEIRTTVSDTSAGTAEDLELIRPSGPSPYAVEQCRREIESCGGTFGIEHEPGRGSTSWFTMRFFISEDVKHDSKSVHDTHALVVGRDGEETKLLSEYFECWDIRHTPCADIEELGITLRLSSDHADLLVVGVNDNLELIEVNEGVHAVIEDHPPSLVGISDDEDPASIAAARRSGVAAIINRPLDQSAMFDAVLAALTHCRSVREHRNEESGELHDSVRATVHIEDQATAHAVMFILESFNVPTMITPRSTMHRNAQHDDVKITDQSLQFDESQDYAAAVVARSLIPQLLNRMSADHESSAIHAA